MKVGCIRVNGTMPDTFPRHDHQTGVASFNPPGHEQECNRGATSLPWKETLSVSFGFLAMKWAVLLHHVLSTVMCCPKVTGPIDHGLKLPKPWPKINLFFFMNWYILGIC
jgi:hypothetical protein